MISKNLTYKKSGVNITAADNFVKYLSQIKTNKKAKKVLKYWRFWIYNKYS